MQLEPHPRYPTMFLIGHRVVAGKAQQVGAAIVKGTFHDLDAPTAVAKAQQVPIFLKDVPFNVVRNSDFEAKDTEENLILEPWQALGGTATKAAGHESDQSVKLTSDGNGDRLTQTLTFDKPVGGRTFILSFYARTDLLTPTPISGFRLQSVASGTSICQISASVTNDFEQMRFESAPETWPASETATEIEVILPGSGNSSIPVYFDRVQVEEATAPTRWDEDTVFRYEHDLIPFKPSADAIVLGPAEPPGDPSPGTWHVEIEINPNLKIEKTYAIADTKELPIKALLGWGLRGKGDRKTQAGNLDAATEEPLPPDFDNLFYNGFDRDTQFGPFPYFVDGTQLTVRSEFQPEPPESFTVQLPFGRPKATLTVLNDSGRENQQGLPLVLDTVVIEPDRDRYLAVWRGTWPLDEASQERYTKLAVTGGP